MIPKFRIWDGGRMIYDPSVGFIEGKYTYRISDIFNEHAPEPMQSTGLLDKNGKEIYEGDIVNTVKENGVEVYYDRGNYWAGIYQLLYLGVAGVEVIGNTYETPELINKQKDFYSYLPYYE